MSVMVAIFRLESVSIGSIVVDHNNCQRNAMAHLWFCHCLCTLAWIISSLDLLAISIVLASMALGSIYSSLDGAPEKTSPRTKVEKMVFLVLDWLQLLLIHEPQLSCYPFYEV